ncbi:MAG TPA: hypothetical protein V6D19_05430 [Stenomitos sp.]
MSEKIKAWETSDGQIFRTLKEAQEHETKLQFELWFKANIDPNFESVGQVVDQIFKAWEIHAKD